MAAAKKNEKEKIKVLIPKVPGQKEQDDVVITINGVTTQIQRGVEVEVSPAVAKNLQLKAREIDDLEAYQFSVEK
jgi:hypothetical protein